MDFIHLHSESLFHWVLIPLLIFLARICDVSIGTMRVIFISRGMKRIAPILGFFEVIIWLLAIGQIMKNVTNVAAYLAYGGGFAMGTYVGMLIEDKMSLGLAIVRIITKDCAAGLIQYLKESNYGITVIDAEGGMGKVKVIFTIVQRAKVQDLIETITNLNPTAFYSVADVRFASEGVFPQLKGSLIRNHLNRFGMRRKGK